MTMLKFPSPCGDYGSYQKMGYKAVAVHDEFPSPCGDYGSYRRPLRPHQKANKEIFPSPCGDYGSYLNRSVRADESRVASFPSPCGDYGSYPDGRGRIQHPCTRNFRPLAGIMVLIMFAAAHERV